MPTYIDTETVGLHGMPVLIQYAEDDGEIKLHSVWTTPIYETLELIEWLCSKEICGFNLSFDWFMICKLYTTFVLFPNLQAIPEDHIDAIAILEEKARFSDICLKPKSALDLMLLARKGPFQSLMAREDIRIRRVPTALAWQLAAELETKIAFDDIYFAKAKDKNAPRWKIYDIKKPDGTINPDFKDIKLKFKASAGLKNLYRHVFRIKDPMFMFSDIEVPRKFWPFDLGYAPYALAVSPNFPQTGSWQARVMWHGVKKIVYPWPGVINQHILHWGYNADARKYASDDVSYTRRLHQEAFGGCPAGDTDSVLACMVAACRWKGYAVDLEEIKKLKTQAKIKIGSVPTAPRYVKRYIQEVMDPSETAAMEASGSGSTKKVVLEEIATWLDDNEHQHPAAKRAQAILEARAAQKEIELYEKILKAERFHASFIVIGTLSSRMAGTDGLNAQGIKHTKNVRRAFILADPADVLIVVTIHSVDTVVHMARMVLSGGDFKSFEVSLAATVFNDPQLTAALKSGKKVHGLMGAKLSGLTYEEVLASEGMDPDWYDKGKKGFFLKCYFGEAYTFNKKLGIPMDRAEQADRDFNRDFPNVKVFQDGVRERFGALSQPGGIGTKINWKEPADYAESFLGFRRYFTLENKIIRLLFQLAQNVPTSWKDAKIKVMRRDRVQTAGGAVSSALYGAAFGIMSGNIRAAGNHYIQSPGAEITKATQANIWTLQPSGIGPWIVQPMNIHDEIMCPTRPGYEKQAGVKAQETVAYYRQKVPLLAIDWMTNISSWAGKKGEIVESSSIAGAGK